MSVLRGGKAVILKAIATIKSVARLITEIRDNIAEPDPERFSNSQLLRFLNRAHEKVYNDIGTCFKRDFFTTTTINLVADQERYDLPADCKRIISIARTKDFGGTTLSRPYRLSFKNYHDRAIYRYHIRSKESYYFIGNKIGILPVPSTNETASITIEYFPRVTELTPSGEISVDSDYSLALILFTTYNVLESEEMGKGLNYRGEYQDVINHVIFENSQKDEGNSDFIRALD